MKAKIIRAWKKHPVIVILSCIVLAGYLTFAFTRFSAYTTYAPFSGRVFDMKENDVKYIRITNGNTTQTINLEKEDAVTKEVIRSLNDFRYNFWLPIIPLGSVGYSYAFGIHMENGEYYSHIISSNGVDVRGVWFHCSNESLQKLMDIVDAVPKKQ